MRLEISNMPHQIVGQMGIKIKTSVTRGKELTPVVENVSQSR